MVSTPLPMTSHGVQKEKELVYLVANDLVNEMIA